MFGKKVALFSFFWIFCAFLQAQETPELLDNAFLVFNHFCKNQQFDENRYIQVAQALPEPYFEYSKSVARWLQQNKKQRKSMQHFNDVRDFLDFLRQHKIFFKAVEFYNVMQAKYIFAFDNAQVIDAVIARAHSVYPLVDFLDQWQKDYNRVHYFEDHLHSRYGITKSKNYALKIELLRVRNNIIFKDEYKDQSWSYKKHHWYQLPYKVVRGIGKGIKEFGAYMCHVVQGPSLGS